MLIDERKGHASGGSRRDDIAVGGPNNMLHSSMQGCHKIGTRKAQKFQLVHYMAPIRTWQS